MTTTPCMTVSLPNERKSEHTCHTSGLHGSENAKAAVYITISADLLHIFHSHILSVLAAPQLLNPIDKNMMQAQHERSQLTVFYMVNMVVTVTPWRQAWSSTINCTEQMSQRPWHQASWSPMLDSTVSRKRTLNDC